VYVRPIHRFIVIPCLHLNRDPSAWHCQCAVGVLLVCVFQDKSCFDGSRPVRLLAISPYPRLRVKAVAASPCAKILTVPTARRQLHYSIPIVRPIHRRFSPTHF
jgi:hypothetical protein